MIFFFFVIIRLFSGHRMILRKGAKGEGYSTEMVEVLGILLRLGNKCICAISLPPLRVSVPSQPNIINAYSGVKVVAGKPRRSQRRKNWTERRSKYP